MTATAPAAPKDFTEALDRISHLPEEDLRARIEDAIKAAPDASKVALPREQESSPRPRPVVRMLKDLERPAPNDPNELIKDRYLCRGGGLLLVGPAGIGKSSFGMQLAVSLTVGRAVFGIQPARPLKVLIIQAENDDGDMAEMRDGVLSGLGFNAAERERATTNVFTCRDDEHAGDTFFESTVIPLLEEVKPDILIIDPAHAYHGGDSSAQTDVGRFLRQQLNPIVRKYGCGVIILHHTNKPPSGKEKTTWSGADFTYLGAGSAEWANWSRAVLAIRQHSEGVYELIAGKRGSRLGWKDTDGETPTFRKFIRHHSTPGTICWEEIPEDEIPVDEKAVKNRPSAGRSDLLKLLSPSKLYRKDSILGLAKSVGIGRDRCRELIATLLDAQDLYEHRISRAGVRPEIQYACYSPNGATD